MPKRLRFEDVKQIMLCFANGYTPMAIERRFGYPKETVRTYGKFYSAVNRGDLDTAYTLRKAGKVSQYAIDWAIYAGFIDNTDAEPIAAQQLEITEEPVPENPQDFTLAGIDALWRELNALAKALDTMTNSLVIELSAINKGLDRLAERWQ